MKAQKARSIIHQHGVASAKLAKLAKLVTTRDIEKEKLGKLEEAPEALQRTLNDLAGKLEALDKQRTEILEKVNETRAALRTTLSGTHRGLDAARNTLSLCQARVASAQKQVDKWVKDLPEAERTLDEITQREVDFQQLVEAEKAKIDPGFAKDQKLTLEELATRNVKDALRGGKPAHSPKHDTMGNKHLAEVRADKPNQAVSSSARYRDHQSAAANDDTLKGD